MKAANLGLSRWADSMMVCISLGSILDYRNASARCGRSAKASDVLAFRLSTGFGRGLIFAGLASPPFPSSYRQLSILSSSVLVRHQL